MATDFYYGSNGQRIELERSEDTLAVAYREAVPEKDRQALIRGDQQLIGFTASRDVMERNIVLYKRSPSAVVTLEDFATRVRSSPAIHYVMAAYRKGSSNIVITDEFIASFKPEVTKANIDAFNATQGVEIVRTIDPETKTFLLRVKVMAADGCLTAARAYFESGLVLYAEPNRITTVHPKFVPNDVFYPRQWHLPRIQSEQAWDITRGDPSVVVAILDDGFDIDHEDLGTGRVVAPRNTLEDNNDPRPLRADDTHGTAVAGVAIATGNNTIGVTGIAPNCRYMPIRMLGTPTVPNAATTDERKAAAFRHAVDNGAAIISNSWGPADNGTPEALPAVIGAEFQRAVTQGRGGKGAVILFASGNGNESMSAPATRDGFADDARVIAVGAVNDVNVRSGYSDFGSGLDVCAPSSTSRFIPDGGTLRIFTTDRTGAAGDNPNPAADALPEASPDLNYTSTFGGTSSACPLAAGVVALMLSTNNDITRDQVQFLLEATADKVDFANTDPVGQYQPNGHSQWYGFGRVNAFESAKASRASVAQRDFSDRVMVTLRRTSGDEFVATQVIQAVDARRRPVATPTDLFVRASTFGFLRAEVPGIFDEVEVD